MGECSGGRPATQGSHTGGRPDWCKWVPAASLQYVGECSGATPSTQGNAGTGHPEWCSRVPAGSLQYVPECSSLAPTTQHGNAGGHPEWCSRVPAASLQYVPECSGLAPATQQGNQPQRPDWCKWVPAASVQYVDQCSGNFAPAQGAGDAGWGYGDGPEGCVNWCVWVPGNKWHERDDCKKCAEYYPVEPQGFAHAGCAGWCQWVSQPSWQYVGNCRGCNANQAAVKAAMPNSSASAKPTGSYSLHFLLAGMGVSSQDCLPRWVGLSQKWRIPFGGMHGLEAVWEDRFSGKPNTPIHSGFVISTSRTSLPQLILFCLVSVALRANRPFSQFWQPFGRGSTPMV